MMTFNKFFISRIALVAALLGAMLLTPTLAVELVGKPVAVGTSSASTAAIEEERFDEDNRAQLAARDPVAANDPQPFGIAKHFEGDSDNTLVQLMAMLLCIGGPIALIIALVAMHYRAKQRRAEDINTNIERLLAAGRDIPLELLRGDEPYIGDEASLIRDDIHLQKGIKNVCLGVGLFVTLTIIFGIEFGAIGFILLSIGVSQLWLWKISGSKRNKIPNQG